MLRALHERTVMIMTLLLVASAVAEGGQAALVVAGIAAMAITSIVAAKYAATVVSRGEMTVGARAHAHREALSVMPAPSHPSTAGRPRTRAPAPSMPAA